MTGLQLSRCLASAGKQKSDTSWSVPLQPEQQPITQHVLGIFVPTQHSSDSTKKEQMHKLHETPEMQAPLPWQRTSTSSHKKPHPIDTSAAITPCGVRSSPIASQRSFLARKALNKSGSVPNYLRLAPFQCAFP